MYTNSFYCVQTTLVMVTVINYTYLHITQAFVLITIHFIQLYEYGTVYHQMQMTLHLLVLNNFSNV